MKIRVESAADWDGGLRLRLVFGAEKPSLARGPGRAGELWLIRGKRGGHEAILSLGPVKDRRPEQFRRAGGLLAQWAAPLELEAVGVEVASADDSKPRKAKTGNGGGGGFGVEEILALVEGFLLGSFRFDHYRENKRSKGVTALCLLTAGQTALWRRRMERAATLCNAVNETRAIAHEPPNVINPVTLAERCKALAKAAGLMCRVLDERQLARMKAGGILAVGQGSATPPRLIVLEHVEARKGARPLVLVGKAVTFDTGGYSIKSADNILGMKYDKCGGTAVLGVMLAAARLRLKRPIVGIIAAAENMISSRAYRPDDILTMMSGKTVQVVSADAEGRLVLADALTYAQKHYKPAAVVNLATLTGGVVVALGNLRAAIMSNHDSLAGKLIAAGERTDEKLWRLPLDDEYLDLLKNDDSDLKNSAGREAHAIQGGMFLKQFIEPGVPWAHLDIAGVADVEKPHPYYAKGATGFGIRLLIDYLSGHV